MLDRNAEILRLIEERSTPKGEKHELKEVSKCIKRCIKKNGKADGIQRVLEDFKGIRNIQVIKSAKERVLIAKIKMRKENASHPEKELQVSLVNFTKKLYKDNDPDESGQEFGGDENKSCIDVQYKNTEERTRIPEITTEELQTAIDKLTKGKSPDSNGIRAEDIKSM